MSSVKEQQQVFLGAVAELWSLFVDDGALALALVLWCGCAVWGFPLLKIEPAIRAPLLLIGCLVILVVDVLWTALRRAEVSSSPR